jgi:chemotaxis signal transduction protein
MNAPAGNLAERAAELRAAFDRGFAMPSRADVSVKHDLIAVRVGTEPFAIRLAEITGLFADRKITHVPGSAAALIGIAGFRGTLVPVYSLRTLLGHSGPQAARDDSRRITARWLVVAAVAPLAFAFDAFEGHLRASADAILPQQQAPTRGYAPESIQRGYAPDFMRAADIVRPILHLPSIAGALGTAQAAHTTSMKE